jgi:outer membrane protein
MQKTLLATLLAGSLLSLNAQAVDLLESYKNALSYDAQYASARATLSAAQERLPQARAGLLPTIGISGYNTRNNNETSPAGSSAVINSSSYNSGYTVSLSQPLFRWANWETYQQSKLSVAGSEAQFAQAHEDLMIRAAQAYFDVLISEDALSFTKAQKIATGEQLASAKSNFEVGTQTITDTHEAQARYDLVISQEFAAQNDLNNRRNAYQLIAGQLPGTLSTLKPGVGITPPQPNNIDVWVSTAQEQNYGVVSAKIVVESAKRDIKKNRAGHYPTVDLAASTGRNKFGGSISTGGGGVQTSNAVGFNWNIPLFTGFAVTSQVREAIALEDKARHDLANTTRNAAQAARQAFLGVDSGLAQIKALEAAEVSSKSALESNKLGYQVGVRINIDVLNAQQQLFSTRRDLSRARYDAIMNGLRLKSAAGTLKEEDLAAVNALLTK